jgi:hypothetical protein
MRCWSYRKSLSALPEASRAVIDLKDNWLGFGKQVVYLSHTEGIYTVFDIFSEN